MIFEPTANGIAPDAEPEATAFPLTVTVEAAITVVGVTVNDDTA